MSSKYYGEIIMTQTIGQIIRKLRKEREMTQEELAEKLCLTPQAVSKWESEISLSDISLVVPPCSLFGVSADVLFGVTPDGIEREIAETRAASEKADSETAISLWENLLKHYPHSVECLFELAQANCWSKTDDGFERAIPLYERVLDEATDDRIRSSSLEGLCRCYRETGNIDAAVRTAKRGTSWRSSKQFLMTQIPESL